jgi:hypothetical protein
LLSMLSSEGKLVVVLKIIRAYVNTVNLHPGCTSVAVRGGMHASVSRLP